MTHMYENALEQWFIMTEDVVRNVNRGESSYGTIKETGFFCKGRIYP